MIPRTFHGTDPAFLRQPRLGCVWGAVLCLCLLTGCERKPAATMESVVNLAGEHVDALKASDAKATVLVFLGVECPISNRYAPELRRLHGKFSASGIRWWLVYPGGHYSAEAIRQHLREYNLPDCALRDPSLALTRKASASVTPEAAVFLPDGRLAYHGRIDDRFPALGTARPEPTQRDLEAVLETILAGKPPVSSQTKAVGCFIPGLP